MLAALLLSLCQPLPTGASVPWTTYEAEAMVTAGTIQGPANSGWVAAREASGRRCVSLSGGQAVTFTVSRSADGLVVRFSLPASATGAEIQGNLLISANGATTSLGISNRFSHQFGAYPFTKIASQGNHRHFWDEARTRIAPVVSGASITVSTNPGSPPVLIDLIDLESVPDPLAAPTNSVSVTEFGAEPNSSADQAPAFRAAITAAKGAGKSVWIPPGAFVIKGTLLLDRVTIQGAGMWHTSLEGVDDYTPENRVNLYGAGSDVTLSDFSINGRLTYRNDSEPNDGVGGTFGTGSKIRNLWIEHTKAAIWVTNSDGLLVEGCRFRNTIADGINLCLGIRNSRVTQCTSRGTGDDGFAMWPATYAPSTLEHGGNVFDRCTAELTYLAQGFSLYGGDTNRVTNCLARDIPYGAGAMVSTTFPTVSGFLGTTSFQGTTLIRCGDDDGALAVVSNQRDIPSLRVSDITVLDSPRDGVKFTSMNGKQIVSGVFERVRFSRFGTSGSGKAIAFSPGALGAARFVKSSFGVRGEGAIGSVPSGFRLEISR